MQQKWIEDAQHQLFTEGGGQGRQAQFDFVASGQPGFDSTVLGAPLFSDIHAGKGFQAADDGQGYLGRELIHRVQQAVDAKAQVTLVASGLQMDITGALIERVLQ
ncbi:hypothetical protein D3C77_558630 [compost metagenome]